MKLRDEPCNRCGWKFPGFHVCLDLSQPSPAEERERKSGRLAAVTSRRWQEYRANLSERNAEMIDRYKEGATYQTLAEEFNISKQSVMRIMKRAEEDGDVVLRTRSESRYLSMGGAYRGAS